MKINNLKIYSSDTLKKINTRLVALSLVGASIFSLGGCGTALKKDESHDDLSIVDVVDCLASEKNLTLIDEYMKQQIKKNDGTICDINSLFIDYNNALLEGDKEEVNNALYYMGKTVLQSLIADTYNLDFEKIKDLDVFMVKAKRINKKNINIYDYPIKFSYENINYTLLPHDKLAIELAYCINKTKTGSLPFRSEDHTIYDAYNIIKAALLFKGEKEDIMLTYEDNKDYYYGTIILNYDYDKLEVYYDTIVNNDKASSNTYNYRRKLKRIYNTY